MQGIKQQTQAGHHLVGIQPNGGMLYYRIAQTTCMAPTADVNIWRLRQGFNGLKTYFDLWGRNPRWVKTSTPEARSLAAVFDAIEAGRPVDRSVLQKAAFLLLGLAPGQYIRKMQRHSDQFESTLTPQYRELLPKVDFSLPARSELLFHIINPELYVWVPPALEQPRRLLICFATKKNTFNMPRPIAHFILARLGIGIMYIGNRPQFDPSEGFMGRGIEHSARLIKKVANDLGFDKLYGLGTSLGGYAVCRYAAPLGLERVLNFSGSTIAPNREVAIQRSLGRLVKDYPYDRILSILSKTDPTDQKILNDYTVNGFDTPREWVDSAAHGTFSAAFIEGRLTGYLSWLLGETDPPHLLKAAPPSETQCS